MTKSDLSTPAEVEVSQRLVDLREAAAHLGVSTRTLWRWLPKHSIRHLRIGKTIRFRVTDLREFVEARLVN
jgi:excisionase family DNA binding protein